MFTPVHIFDRVISLIESKRELTWFEHFKSVTKVDAKWVQYQESPHIKLVFTSKLDNPIEKREEINGPSKKTIITNSMTFIIEPSSKMIKVLKVDQVERLQNFDEFLPLKGLVFTSFSGQWPPEVEAKFEDIEKKSQFELIKFISEDIL